MDARRLLIFLFAVGLIPTVSALAVHDDLYINASSVLDGKWHNITDAGSTGVIIMNCTSCTLDCNGTTINGSNAGRGIGASATEDYFIIANCSIINYDVGIYFTGSSHNLVRNVTINVDDYALETVSDSEYNNFTNMTMTAGQIIRQVGGSASQYNNYSYNTMLATGSGNALHLEPDSYTYYNEIRKTQTGNAVLTCNQNSKIVGNNLTHDDGIVITTVGQNCLIYDNNLTSPLSKGVYQSSAATGVNISYNYFNVKNDAIEIDYWYDSYIHDNHIEGQGVNGIAIFIGTHDVQVYNNTIVMTSGDGFHWRQCWDITAWDNKITTTGQAVDFYDCENSTISNSSFGAGKIYAHSDATNNTLLNVTYTGAETVSDTSWFYRKWYARVYTNYTNGSAATGAYVYWYNTSDKLVDNGTTDATGNITLVLIQYKNDSGTTINYVNYTVNATDGTTLVGELTNVTLSSNRNLNITLQDIIAPTVTWVWNVTRNETNTYSSINASVKASETIIACNVNISGTNYTMSQANSTGYNYTWAIGADGNYTLRAYCNDTFNNTGSSSLAWYDLDTTPPTVTWNTTVFTEINSSVSSADVNVSVDTNEYTTCNLAVNGTNQSMTSSGSGLLHWAYLSLSQGNSTFKAYCNDTVNYTSSSTTSWVFVDTINPLVSVTSPSNGSTISSQSVTIQISHTETNPHNLTLNFDGTNTTYSYSGSTTSITKSGMAWNTDHWFIVYVNDTVGNTNQTGNYSFHVQVDAGSAGSGARSTALLFEQIGGMEISAIAPLGGFQTTKRFFTLGEIGGDLILENRGAFVIRPEIQLGTYADILPPIFPGETYSLKGIELSCNQPTCTNTLLLIVNGMRDTFTFDIVRTDLTRAPIQYSRGFSPLSIIDNGGLVDLAIIIVIFIIVIGLLAVFLRRR